MKKDECNNSMFAMILIFSNILAWHSGDGIVERIICFVIYALLMFGIFEFFSVLFQHYSEGKTQNIVLVIIIGIGVLLLCIGYSYSNIFIAIYNAISRSTGIISGN